MGKIKPIDTSSKFGLIIGFIILISGVIAMITKWQDFYHFFAPAANRKEYGKSL